MPRAQGCAGAVLPTEEHRGGARLPQQEQDKKNPANGRGLLVDQSASAQASATLLACGPLSPSVMSKLTRCPSARDLKPPA
jgi:hypothetical protein